MKGKDERYPDYPLFKGLQRPLEFMGIQGRYIYWAAGVAGGAIVGFIIAYCLAGFVVGLVVLVAVVSTGIALHTRYRPYHAQTAERAAYQERRARGVYLRPLEEAVRRKEKPSRATCGLVEC